MRFLLILSLLGFFPSAYGASWAYKPLSATYVVKYDGIPVGKSITTLKIFPKHHYLLCVDNKTTIPFLKGITKECSEGTFSNQTVQPQHYEYYYHQNSTTQRIHIDFDWTTHLAQITANETHWRLNFPDNVQDRLSYHLLIRKGLFYHQQKFSFPVADGGKLKTYNFIVVKEEKLALPWKTLNTIQLDRTAPSNKENLSLWLMKDYDFVVAKIKQNKHFIDVGTAEIENAKI